MITPVDKTDMSPVFVKIDFERREFRSPAPDRTYIHDKFSGNGSGGGGGEGGDSGDLVFSIRVNASGTLSNKDLFINHLDHGEYGRLWSTTANSPRFEIRFDSWLLHLIDCNLEISLSFCFVICKILSTSWSCSWV